MFPPFIDSFGAQFSAVMINTVGTVIGGLFTAIFGSFVTNFLSPLFQGLAAAFGLPAQ